MTGGIRMQGHLKKSMPGHPLVSIITVVLDAKNELEAAIEEVKRQTYPDKEHIIIDGGSTDGTLDILRKNDTEIDYWTSEADTGIYDAMNKGVDLSLGEWFYFFGAGDVFYKGDTIESIIMNRAIADNVALVFGNVIYPDGRLFKSRFGKSLYFKNTIHHQSVFYRRNVFETFRYGLSPLAETKRQYYISGDYQLNLMLFLQGVRHIHVNRIVARCASGVSMQGRWFGYLEEILIRHQLIGFFKAVFFDVFTLLRYVRKRLYQDIHAIIVGTFLQ